MKGLLQVVPILLLFLFELLFRLLLLQLRQSLLFLHSGSAIIACGLISPLGSLPFLKRGLILVLNYRPVVDWRQLALINRNWWWSHVLCHRRRS